MLEVIYLIFNEGYAASQGEELIREPLCEEAIRLARLIVRLFPEEPELRGLLALCLIQHLVGAIQAVTHYRADGGGGGGGRKHKGARNKSTAYAYTGRGALQSGRPGLRSYYVVSWKAQYGK